MKVSGDIENNKRNLELQVVTKWEPVWQIHLSLPIDFIFNNTQRGGWRCQKNALMKSITPFSYAISRW